MDATFVREFVGCETVHEEPLELEHGEGDAGGSSPGDRGNARNFPNTRTRPLPLSSSNQKVLHPTTPSDPPNTTTTMLALRRNVAAALALAPRTQTAVLCSAVCTRYAPAAAQAATAIGTGRTNALARSYATTGTQVQSPTTAEQAADTDVADEPAPAPAQRDAADPLSSSANGAEPNEFDVDADADVGFSASRSRVPNPSAEEEAKIFVGNMPYDASEDDLRALLADCGDIVRVQPHVFPDTGRFRGSAHVIFASQRAAAAAIALDGTALLGRSVTIQKAVGAARRQRDGWGRDSTGRPQRNAESATLFVGNLPYEFFEDDLRRLFEKYGPLKGVRVAQDLQMARSKGFAHVEFESVARAKEALEELAGTVVEGRAVRLDYAGEFRSGERREPREPREYGERRGGYGERRERRSYGVRDREQDAYGEEEEDGGYGRRRGGRGGY